MARDKRRDQLQAVGWGHAVIVVAVLIILAAWVDDVSAPLGFLLSEGLIISACGVLALDPDSVPGRWVLNDSDPRARRDKYAPVVLPLAFALQLLALVFLLQETGGPIDSPFAQMIVVGAIFVPVIAEYPRTSRRILATTLLYYVLFVCAYGPGVLNVSSTEAPVLAVNVMVLVAAFVVTEGEQRAKAREAEAAAASSD